MFFFEFMAVWSNFFAWNSGCPCIIVFASESSLNLISSWLVKLCTSLRYALIKRKERKKESNIFVIHKYDFKLKVWLMISSGCDT